MTDDKELIVWLDSPDLMEDHGRQPIYESIESKATVYCSNIKIFDCEQCNAHLPMNEQQP